MERTSCRICGSDLGDEILDLGAQPLANGLADQAGAPAPLWPLALMFCSMCRLVQLGSTPSSEAMFGEYLYLTGFSETQCVHGEAFARRMIKETGLRTDSLVIEVASNDGSQMAPFAAHSIPVLGIEPAALPARRAMERGLSVLQDYLTQDLAREIVNVRRPADLVIANNVLAHVPDPGDFLKALVILAKEDGLIVVEFPHLQRMVEDAQFDVIYHEHACYFSLLALESLIRDNHLVIEDVEATPVHGGSLRLFLRKEGVCAPSAKGRAVMEQEEAAHLTSMAGFQSFSGRVKARAGALCDELRARKSEGARIAGYGAPAKATVLVNYCGLGKEIFDYTVDRNPFKQGKLIPGRNIPIHAPEVLFADRPDIILIFPWNLEEEIAASLDPLRKQGTRLLVASPEIRYLP